MPNEPPSCWKTLIELVARDTASRGRPAYTPAIAGTSAEPIPAPLTSAAALRRTMLVSAATPV
jgi:hypothetical protein